MIHLSDGYAISVDSRCYTVGIPRSQTIDNKKTGETKETTIMTDAKYYTSLDKALVGWWQTMRNKELSNFDGSLDEAIEVIKKQDEKIKNIISKIKIVYDSTKLMDEVNNTIEEVDKNEPNTGDEQPVVKRRGRPRKSV